MKQNYFASYYVIIIFLIATIQKSMAYSKIADDIMNVCYSSYTKTDESCTTTLNFPEKFQLKQNNVNYPANPQGIKPELLFSNLKQVSQYLNLEHRVKFFYQNSSLFNQVNTPDEIKEFKMFPNPASQGFVNITTKKNANKEILIYDVLGKMVLKANIKQKRLDISTLSPGIYILKATEGKQTSTRKLVVQ